MGALKQRILRGEHQLVLELMQEASTRMPVYLACLCMSVFRQFQYCPAGCASAPCRAAQRSPPSLRSHALQRQTLAR